MITDDLQASDAQPPRFKTKVICGIALAVLFPFVIDMAFQLSLLNFADRLFYSRFIYWAEVLLLMAYAYRVERQPFLIWKDRSRNGLFFAGSVALLYLLALAAGFASNIPHLLGMRENSELIAKITAILKGHYPLLVFIALTAGVTEELIFRGYVLTRLSLLFKGQFAAVIVSALLFAALHYKYFSLREFIFAFLIGLILGFYYQKYRNITVVIVAHFLVDLVNLTIAVNYLK